MRVRLGLFFIVLLFLLLVASNLKGGALPRTAAAPTLVTTGE